MPCEIVVISITIYVTCNPEIANICEILTTLKFSLILSSISSVFPNSSPLHKLASVSFSNKSIFSSILLEILLEIEKISISFDITSTFFELNIP